MQPSKEKETSVEKQLEIREMSRYMYLGEEHTDKSPLQWWSENKGKYPVLSQLAARYLAIPATSVPCERVFSLAGHIVNDASSKYDGRKP